MSAKSVETAYFACVIFYRFSKPLAEGRFTDVCYILYVEKSTELDLGKLKPTL